MQSSRSQVVFSVGVHRGGRAQLRSEVAVGIGRGLLLQSAVLRRSGIKMFRDGEGAGQHEHGGEGGGDGEHHGADCCVFGGGVCGARACVGMPARGCTAGRLRTNCMFV